MSITYGPKLGKIINADIGEFYPDDFRALLRSYDALVQGSVIDIIVTAPPSSPSNGDAYIVPASGATGAWAGHANQVVVWSTELTVTGTNTKVPGWEFYTPRPGWTFYVTASGTSYAYNGTSWAVVSSGGGGYPGVTSDGSNGLTITGGVAAASISIQGSSSGSYVKADGTGYGTPGGGESRQTVSVTTASLANLATENLTVVMAKTVCLIAIHASTECRVRLYSTAAQRTADSGRANNVPPLTGTQNGIICDVQLDDISVPDGFPTTWYLAPPSIGSNCDSSPSATIYYAIQNLSGGTSTVTVTFTFLVLEV